MSMSCSVFDLNFLMAWCASGPFRAIRSDSAGPSVNHRRSMLSSVIFMIEVDSSMTVTLANENPCCSSSGLSNVTVPERKCLFAEVMDLSIRSLSSDSRATRATLGVKRSLLKRSSTSLVTSSSARCNSLRLPSQRCFDSNGSCCRGRWGICTVMHAWHGSLRIYFKQ